MMSYKLQRNVYLIFHNRHFLKNTRRTQLAHHGVRFLNTAEIACTAQPAGRIERCINGKVGKTLFYVGSHRIGFILGLTGVIWSSEPVGMYSEPIKAPIRAS